MIDSNSDWVRLAEPVTVRVMIYQGDGVWAEAGKATLPKGWYAGPGPRK